MAEINLDDLLRAKGASEGNAAPPALEEVTAERIERDIAVLTPEEQGKVTKIKDAIDPMNTESLLSFGAPAQKKIADFSEGILREVRTKDAGEAGALLSSLVTEVKKYDGDGDGFLTKIPLVGDLVKKAEAKKQGYDKLSVQVDRIAGALEQSRLSMMKDVVRFDKMYAENLAYFKELELYIRAGEEKLTELRNVTLPKLEAQAAASSDPMAGQVVADFAESINRFEKKVHDLKISKTIAIQTAPQIRLIQNNDKALIDRVQSAIYQTIPLWKNQLVIALGLEAQSKALALQKQVNDTTNELLRKNAALLEANTIGMAQENERSVVDIDTVREVNEKLIHTIEETMRIGQEARAKRQAAEKELVQIEGRLRDTLLKHSAGRGGT